MRYKLGQLASERQPTVTGLPQALRCIFMALVPGAISKEHRILHRYFQIASPRDYKVTYDYSR